MNIRKREEERCSNGLVCSASLRFSSRIEYGLGLILSGRPNNLPLVAFPSNSLMVGNGVYCLVLALRAASFSDPESGLRVVLREDYLKVNDNQWNVFYNVCNEFPRMT